MSVVCGPDVIGSLCVPCFCMTCNKGPSSPKQDNGGYGQPKSPIGTPPDICLTDCFTNCDPPNQESTNPA